MKAKQNANAALEGQSQKNEALQSELDKTKKSMGDALAKANVEITQRGRILEIKERELQQLQSKYAALVEDGKVSQIEAKKEIDTRVQDLTRMEASLKMQHEERGVLEKEIVKFKGEIERAKGEVRKSGDVRDGEMKKMEQVSLFSYFALDSLSMLSSLQF